jgi:PAS domain-containing protein
MGPRPGATSGAPAGLVTHGICPTCQQHFFAPRDRSLSGFLNSLDAPVVVVDRDVRILEANDTALRVMGKARTEVAGHLGGDVIECARARLPGGCGHTVHCTACTLRNTVHTTHATGQGVAGATAWMRLSGGPGEELAATARVQISTEKVGDVVVLRFDDIEKLTQRVH